MLVVAEALDEASRAQIQKYPGQTVLVIDSRASVQSATNYLLGLSGVNGVDEVCAMQGCNSASRAVRDPQ